MSISSTVRKAGPFIGNGSAATFSFGFKVFTSADLSVLLLNPNGIQSTLALTTDYTVALNPNQDSNPGGSITLTAGVLASGYSLVVTTAIPELQGVELQNLGAFFPGVINDALDRLTILDQQLQESIGRALKFPIVDGALSSELLSAANRANKYLAFAGDGTPIVVAQGPVSAVVPFAAIDVRAYGAKCDGVTDDSAALATAMTAAGSMSAPPTFTYEGATHNKRQGVVQFPANTTTKITTSINVPPGVIIDLNNSTINMTGVGDAFVFAYDYIGGYGYGTYFGGIRNGFINGPGSGTSTGSGIFLNVASFFKATNVQVQGFKFGLKAWECQYSGFEHVYCTNNKVGMYFTARPTATTLTSIDLSFTDVMADLNDIYGFWFQTCAASQLDKVDASRNGVADIVIGSQLVKYISAYTVTSGGSGYTINAKLPVTITDATGLYAQAYAQTNGSGVITGVFGVDAGQGYTAPSISVAGGGVAAVVTATVSDDTGLGDWNGVSATQYGNLTFNTVKSEHTLGADGPKSGYAVLINSGASGLFRGVTFNGYQLQRQSGGGRDPYFRLAFNQGFGNAFNWLGDSSGSYDSISNPAVSGDVSIIRNVTSQGITTRWNAFAYSSLDNLYKFVIDETGAASYSFKDAVIGFTPQGFVAALAYHSQSSFSGGAAEESQVVGDTIMRFSRSVDGKMQWGPGGAGVLDANLYRSGAGTLKMDGAFIVGTSHQIGATGTAIVKFAKYTATLSPSAVAANTTAEQNFTVTGVAVGDTVVGVSKSTAQAGLGIVGWRVIGLNTIGITFINATGSPITPTASEVYAFEVIQ